MLPAAAAEEGCTEGDAGWNQSVPSSQHQWLCDDTDGGIGGWEETLWPSPTHIFPLIITSQPSTRAYGGTAAAFHLRCDWSDWPLVVP